MELQVHIWADIISKGYLTYLDLHEILLSIDLLIYQLKVCARSLFVFIPYPLLMSPAKKDLTRIRSFWTL